MSKQNHALMVDDQSPSFSFSVLPEAKVSIELKRLQDTETFSLVTAVNFSIVGNIDLVDSFAGKGSS
jgi:hypothetical protein